MWVRGLKLKIINQIEIFPRSHPMWVRGLKPLSSLQRYEERCVAPHVGAWIETFLRCQHPINFGKSHPMWVRGLKRHIVL